VQREISSLRLLHILRLWEVVEEESIPGYKAKSHFPVTLGYVFISRH
jgi:hypothetical protein